LNHAIRRLEEQIGVRLLTRTTPACQRPRSRSVDN